MSMVQFTFSSRGRGLPKLGRNCFTPDPSPSREAQDLRAAMSIDVQTHYDQIGLDDNTEEVAIKCNPQEFPSDHCECTTSGDSVYSESGDSSSAAEQLESDLPKEMWCDYVPSESGDSSSVEKQLEADNSRLLEENEHLRQEAALALENQRLLREVQTLREEQLLAEENQKLLQENLLLRRTCEEILKMAHSEPQFVTMRVPVHNLVNRDKTDAAPNEDYHSTPSGHCNFPPGVWHKSGVAVATHGNHLSVKQSGSGAPKTNRSQKTTADHADRTAALKSNKLPDERTTLMLRNLPNNYSLKTLLELIDMQGFAGQYDFIYLPIDFVTEAALAYAFVNFSSHEAAEKCRIAFDGFHKWSIPSKKKCIVSWSAPCQGLEEHIERYRNSPVMHESVPLSFQPAVFENGIRVKFPAPTKTVRPPRVRSGRSN